MRRSYPTDTDERRETINDGGGGNCCGQSRTASDQHQPASSRATAVFATTARLCRASNDTHRECRRWLARCPRSRAAGVARSWRRRSVHAGPIRLAVMPGRFDQQPAGVAVAGLGDRPLRPRPAGGGLGGHQPEVGADRPPGQPVPVPDLDREPERGQRRDPTQAAQPDHHGGELAGRGHLGDRGIEPVPARHRGQQRVVGDVEGQPQTGQGEHRAAALGTQPQIMDCRSRAYRRSRRSPGAATTSTTGAAPTSDPRGHPRGPAPDHGRLPARRWAR